MLTGIDKTFIMFYKCIIYDISTYDIYLLGGMLKTSDNVD